MNGRKSTVKHGQLEEATCSAVMAKMFGLASAFAVLFFTSGITFDFVLIFFRPHSLPSALLNSLFSFLRSLPGLDACNPIFRRQHSELSSKTRSHRFCDSLSACLNRLSTIRVRVTNHSSSFRASITQPDLPSRKVQSHSLLHNLICLFKDDVGNHFDCNIFRLWLHKPRQKRRRGRWWMPQQLPSICTSFVFLIFASSDTRSWWRSEKNLNNFTAFLTICEDIC